MRRTRARRVTIAQPFSAQKREAALRKAVSVFSPSETPCLQAVSALASPTPRPALPTTCTTACIASEAQAWLGATTFIADA